MTTITTTKASAVTGHSSKRKADQMSAATTGEPETKRPYNGKCQYKTGKCFNERTLKRNGDAHSLCEEHRTKQNLIQRRSDRKYQKVHAIRRRERSQRRAELKKQVSTAVAQQFFIESQQQKTFSIPLPQYQYHVQQMIPTNCIGGSTLATTAAGTAGLAPRIQVPQPLSAVMVEDRRNIGSPLVLSFSQIAAPLANTSVSDELSPTGTDDFTPYSFLGVPMPLVSETLPVLQYDEIMESSSFGDDFGYMRIGSSFGDKQAWSDADIEFLQTLLQEF
ncbi:hypothetical protein PR003_g494 [Phytophthora rubi]|uniref:Uncharacterized protein n=1 Tax=Phytophthora rubi TaxID=129364 RepID=A0A6A3MUU0_9STRA|nr:hypothetical protein PR002_g7734 [Phytophthora rubi]KAE9047178.1 hypothetical protein PR001_g4315 [Phytophthora rubi]KAE9359917.1 hypothetical protein PR003_g494 [Phytophthora rubi]